MAVKDNRIKKVRVLCPDGVKRKFREGILDSNRGTVQVGKNRVAVTGSIYSGRFYPDTRLKNHGVFNG